MGKHPSKPFNPLLANAFFRAGYIESWGRGIEKILRAYGPGHVQNRLRLRLVKNALVHGGKGQAWDLFVSC